MLLDKNNKKNGPHSSSEMYTNMVKMVCQLDL